MERRGFRGRNLRKPVALSRALAPSRFRNDQAGPLCKGLALSTGAEAPELPTETCGNTVSIGGLLDETPPKPPSMFNQTNLKRTPMTARLLTAYWVYAHLSIEPGLRRNKERARLKCSSPFPSNCEAEETNPKLKLGRILLDSMEGNNRAPFLFLFSRNTKRWTSLSRSSHLAAPSNYICYSIRVTTVHLAVYIVPPTKTKRGSS